ncbi:DUF188 domain-containing protein [Alkalicoccus chagannorensis]|uniref:DUF188 domain-containing protein n=1 Tax=Alkalicoccus chagannorensis TaxID=427072 RepID=UPI0014768C12|nr:DUF188 domain-containing protein [Alkalicoccus chagannorensis]
MKPIHVWVDADASPVVPQLLQLKKELPITLTLVHSPDHIRRDPPADVEIVVVERGPDAADFYIMQHCRRGDIVITDDLGFASMVEAKGAVPLQSNGRQLRREMLDGLLEMRHAAAEERRAGRRTKGPSKRKKQHNDAFTEGFRCVVNDMS